MEQAGGVRRKFAGGKARDKSNLSSAYHLLGGVPQVYKARRDHVHTLTSSITQAPNSMRFSPAAAP